MTLRSTRTALPRKAGCVTAADPRRSRRERLPTHFKSPVLGTLLRSAGNARPERTGIQTCGAAGPIDSAARDRKRDLKVHAVQVLLGGHRTETAPELIKQRFYSRLLGLFRTGRYPKLCGIHNAAAPQNSRRKSSGAENACGKALSAKNSFVCSASTKSTKFY